jgi:hypothetical protein
MELKEFVDKGEEITKEGENLVLYYNKTLGCAAPRGGRYLDSFELIEPDEWCCAPMHKVMDRLCTDQVFGLTHSKYDGSKNPSFGIQFISELEVEGLERDERPHIELIPIKFCPFCQAEIILKCKDIFQLKLKKKVETTCQTYKEKVNGV